MMNNFVFIVVCIVLILSIGCNEQKPSVTGIWELSNSETCNKNFLGLSSYIYPHVRYGHKIYISDSIFYNPFVIDTFNENLPFERSYHVERSHLMIDELDPIFFNKKDSILTLKKNGCTLTFIKKEKKVTLSNEKVEEIVLYIRDDDDILLDSLHLYRTTENEHIFRISEMIHKDDFNKVFDKNVSDSNKYKIVLKLTSGQYFGVTTYGKYETPFEVKTLITYLLDN